MGVAADKIKVVCQGCGARYQVSADKVRGHRFRATCKRCGGTIVSKGDNITLPPDDPDEDFPTRAAADGLSVDDIRREVEANWYVVVDGRPHGPLTALQIRKSHAAGQIDSDTYIWGAGDAEWRPLSEVPHFSDVVSEPKTRMYTGEGEPGRVAPGAFGAEEPASAPIGYKATQETKAATPMGARKQQDVPSHAAGEESGYPGAGSGYSSGYPAQGPSYGPEYPGEGSGYRPEYPTDDPDYDPRYPSGPGSYEQQQARGALEPGYSAEPPRPGQSHEPEARGPGQGHGADGLEPPHGHPARAAGPFQEAMEDATREVVRPEDSLDYEPTRMIDRDFSDMGKLGPSPASASAPVPAPDNSSWAPPPVVAPRKPILPAPTGKVRREDLRAMAAPPVEPESVIELEADDIDESSEPLAELAAHSLSPAQQLPTNAPPIPPQASGLWSLADGPSGRPGAPREQSGVSASALEPASIPDMARPSPAELSGSGAMGRGGPAPASPAGRAPALKGYPPGSDAPAAPMGYPPSPVAPPVSPGPFSGGAAGADLAAWPGPVSAPVTSPTPSPQVLTPSGRGGGFWTTGKIIAAASIGGGLVVAVAVVVAVSLFKGEGESAAVSGGAQGTAVASAAPITNSSADPGPDPAAPPSAGAAEADPSASASPQAPPEPSDGGEVDEQGDGEDAAEDGATEGPDEDRPQEVKYRPPQNRARAKPRRRHRPRRRRRPPRRRAHNPPPAKVNHDVLLGAGAQDKGSVDHSALLGGGSKPKSGGGSVNHDALLGGGGGGGKPSSAAISRAINGVMSKVRSCSRTHNQTGRVRIKFVLNPSGTAQLEAVGQFAGTQLGFCVIGALERARYPRFSGSPHTFYRTFTLR